MAFDHSTWKRYVQIRVRRRGRHVWKACVHDGRSPAQPLQIHEPFDWESQIIRDVG